MSCWFSWSKHNTSLSGSGFGTTWPGLRRLQHNRMCHRWLHNETDWIKYCIPKFNHALEGMDDCISGLFQCPHSLSLVFTQGKCNNIILNLFMANIGVFRYYKVNNLASTTIRNGGGISAHSPLPEESGRGIFGLASLCFRPWRCDNFERYVGKSLQREMPWISLHLFIHGI